MKQRIITGSILTAFLIPVLVFSGTPVFGVFSIFSIVLTLFALVGTWEMLHCIGTHRKLAVAVPSFAYSLLVCSAAKVFMEIEFPATATPRDYFAWSYIGLTFFLFIFLATSSIFSKGKFPVNEMFATFGGVFYVNSAFAALVLLRDSYLGGYMYLLAIIIPLVSDTFAYFTGVTIGKHKLIPDVSPKKTVEGAIGGTVFSGIACIIYAVVLLHRNGYGMSVPQYIGVFFAGCLIAILSMIGDLLASLIKRHYGIKDYGKIFPGHGGVLDRLDSILITSPLILLFSFILQYISVHKL